MGTRRRGRRSTGNGQLTDSELQHLRRRLGVYEQAASQSTASHFRRRPVVGSVLNESIGEQIAPANLQDLPATKLPNIGSLNGDVPESKLPQSISGHRIARRSIPPDALARVDGRDIMHKSIPPEAIIGVKWDDIKDPPSFAGFVRQAEIKKFLTVAEADKRYRKK